MVIATVQLDQLRLCAVAARNKADKDTGSFSSGGFFSALREGSFHHSPPPGAQLDLDLRYLPSSYGGKQVPLPFCLSGFYPTYQNSSIRWAPCSHMLTGSLRQKLGPSSSSSWNTKHAGWVCTCTVLCTACFLEVLACGYCKWQTQLYGSDIRLGVMRLSPTMQHRLGPCGPGPLFLTLDLH